MTGWIGVALCALAAAALFLVDPTTALGMPDASHAKLVFAAALIATAGAAALLGLFSPAWSLARQACMWSAAALAAFAIGSNLQALTAGLTGPGSAERVAAVGSGEGRANRAVEIKAGEHGHFIADVEIDRTKVTVLIDTGATKVALSYEDAERVGLNPFGLDFEEPISTANGVVKAASVTLDRVEVDRIVVRDVEALVLPEGVMRGTLLGMSFLNRLSGFRIAKGTLILEN